MNLHENKKLFTDAVLAASQHLNISPIFVEKDYWITRSLKLLALSDKDNRAIFKGGTSLSKAHNIGYRFSEDIDIAIIDAASMNGNQRKMLIKRLAKSMTAGLDEIPTPGVTSKGSSFYKAIYGYDRISELNYPLAGTGIKLGQIMVEINSFANPYPYDDCLIDNFIRVFLSYSGHQDLVDEYGLGTFRMKVLDKKRTASEKIVSLLRFSMAIDFESELTKKIRHFYDLYFLMNDDDCWNYFFSNDFTSDLKSLLGHDKDLFDYPDGWNKRPITDSPLFSSLEELWHHKLVNIYEDELSKLAYQSIPSSELVLKNLFDMMEHVKTLGIR